MNSFTCCANQKGEHWIEYSGVTQSLSSQVTSQHPYCEEFIGPPHVYTIDVNVLSEVEEAMKEIMVKEVNVFSALQRSIALQTL